MAKHEYCGACIFCNSKCPECGSTSVRVKFKASFEYDNDQENRIELSRDLGDIELECYECGECIQSTDYERDKRLSNLWNTLDRVLELPDGLEADWKDGVVTYSPFRYE